MSSSSSSTDESASTTSATASVSLTLMSDESHDVHKAELSPIQVTSIVLVEWIYIGVLFVAGLSRVSIVSGVYLLCFLLNTSPLSFVRDLGTVSSVVSFVKWLQVYRNKRLLVFLFSFLVTIGHPILQAVLFIDRDAGNGYVPVGSSTEDILLNFGLKRLDIAFSDILLWVLPDFVVMVVSLLSFLWLRHFGQRVNDSPIDVSGPLRHFPWATTCLFFLACIVAGIATPNATALLYYAFFLFAILVWSFNLRLSRAVDSLVGLISFASMAHIILLYVGRFDFMNSTRESHDGRVVGLFEEGTNGWDLWAQYINFAAVHCVFIFGSVYMKLRTERAKQDRVRRKLITVDDSEVSAGTYAKGGHLKDTSSLTSVDSTASSSDDSSSSDDEGSSSSSSSSADDGGESLDSGSTTAGTPIGRAKMLMIRFAMFMETSGMLFATSIVVAYAVTFPNYLSLFPVFMMFLGIVLPPKVLRLFWSPIMMYIALNAIANYCYQLPFAFFEDLASGSDGSFLKQVGLERYTTPLLNIGIQSAVVIFFAIYGRVRRSSVKIAKDRRRHEKRVQQERRIDPRDLPTGARYRLYISSFLELLWFGLLQSAYVLMLLVIYVVSTQSISLIHAGYVLVLILCSLSPRRARQMWKVVVLLFEVSILVRLVYHVRPFDGLSESDAKLIGFVLQNDVLWLGMAFDLILLFFAVVQMGVFELLKEEEKNLQKKHHRESILAAKLKKNPNIRLIRTVISGAFTRVGLYVCLVAFLLVGVFDTLSMIGLIFLLFFQLSIFLYQLSKSFTRILRAVFPFFVIFSSLVFSWKYAVLFADVHDWMSDWSVTDTFSMRELGFPFHDSNIMLELFPYAAIFFLVCMQRLEFQRTSDIVGDDAKTIYELADVKFKDLSKPMQTIVTGIDHGSKFVKRVLILHSWKATIIVTAIAGVDTLDLPGFTLYCVLLVMMGYPKSGDYLLFPLQFFAQGMMIARYLFQFNVFDRNGWYTDTARYFGFQPFNDFFAATFTYLLLMVTLVLHRVAARFVEAVEAEHEDLYRTEFDEICPLFVTPHWAPNANVVPSLMPDSTSRKIAPRSSTKYMTDKVLHFLSEVFQRQGYEITMFVILVTSFHQLTVVGIMLFLIFVVALFVGRVTAAKYWYLLVYLLIAITFAQYFLQVGLPPFGDLTTHPWRLNTDEYNNYLGIRLNFRFDILAPFFSLFFALMQARVFRLESKHEFPPEPLHDFTQSPRDPIDSLMLFVYRSFKEVVLVIMFVSGTVQYSVLSLGYLIISLGLMLFSRELQFKGKAWWTYVVQYVTVVLFLRAAFQGPWFPTPDNAWDWQYVLGLRKLTRDNVYTDTGILFDVVLLVFVAIQYQIYSRYEYGFVLKFYQRQALTAEGRAYVHLVRTRDKQQATLSILREERQQRRARLAKLLARNEGAIQEREAELDALSSEGEYSSSDESSSGESADDGGASMSSPRYGPSSLTLMHGRMDSDSEGESVSSVSQLDDGGSSDTTESGSSSTAASSSEDASGSSESSGESSTAESDSSASSTDEASGSSDASGSSVSESASGSSSSGASGSSSSGDASGSTSTSESSSSSSSVQSDISALHTDDNKNAGPSPNIVKKTARRVYQAFMKMIRLLTRALYSLSYKRTRRVIWREPKNDWQNLLNAAWAALMQNTAYVAYILMAISHAGQANVLTVAYAITALCYALPVRPRPHKLFWTFLITYSSLTILTRYIWNLDIFCFCAGTNTFEVQPKCFDTPLCAVAKEPDRSTQLDYLIGLRKFPSGALHFFGAVFLDFLAIGIIRLHRNNLRYQGRWDPDPVQKDEAEESDTPPPGFMHSLMFWKPNPERDAAQRQHDKYRVLLHQQHDEERAARLARAQKRTTARKKGQLKEKEAPQLSIFQRIVAWFLMLKDKLLKTEEAPIDMDADDGLSSDSEEESEDLGVRVRLGRDLYVLMFFVDTLVFLMLILLWNTAIPTESDESVSSSVQNSQISGSFVSALLVQFALMVIDRIVYLMRLVNAKMVLQWVQVTMIHLYFFFLLPPVFDKAFGNNPGLIVIYITKMVYFFVSGLQIHYGYPEFTGGQFLTRSAAIAYATTFKVYKALPFVYELRTLLDWTVTPTTLDFYFWLKLEDIYSNLYLVKARNEALRRKGRQLGDKQATGTKISTGAILFLVLVAVVWGPLVLFSSLNPASDVDAVTAAKVSLRLGAYEPLYESQTAQSIEFMTSAEIDALKVNHPGLKPAQNAGLQLTKMPSFSKSQWLINPPTRDQLYQAVQDISQPLSVVLEYEFELTNNKLPIKGRDEVEIDAISRLQFAWMLNATRGATSLPYSILLREVYPELMKIPVTGGVQVFKDSRRLNLYLNLERPVNSEAEWWTVTTEDPDVIAPNSTAAVPDVIGKNVGDGMQFTTVAPKVIKDATGGLVSGGVIGVYLTIVLSVGRFLRMYVSGIVQRIPLEDMPQTDSLMKDCMDIYLARQDGDFVLEETLYKELVEVYRSTEEMIARSARSGKIKTV